ncbi:MAG TPA: AraC family transcriptional regulator [Longimicrobiales bacterium]
MDPLSDVLRVLRLTGAVFFTARLSAPWAFRSPPPRELALSLGLRPDCMALFHILVEGRCWLQVGGFAPIQIDAGTVIVLPHGHAHTVSSRLDLEPKPLGVLLDSCSRDAVPVAEYGSGAADARFICGYLHWDQRFDPLMGTLPMLLIACPRLGVLISEPGEVAAEAHGVGPTARSLARAARTRDRPSGHGGSQAAHTAAQAARPAASTQESDLAGPMPRGGRSEPRDGGAEPRQSTPGPGGPEGFGDDGWLETMLRYTIEEAEGRRPGSPAMLTRLVELLYLEMLRQYMRPLPEGHTGWLAAVRHPEVGRALRLLHEQPARKWTVDSLARAAYMSRSALGQRFTDMVGEPPMRYLTGWRMQLAQNLLRQPELSIAQVAARVGYDSDVAFHRAFKRYVGVPPGVWRKGVG